MTVRLNGGTLFHVITRHEHQGLCLAAWICVTTKLGASGSNSRKALRFGARSGKHCGTVTAAGKLCP